MTGPRTVLFTSQNPTLFVELQQKRPDLALLAIGSTVPSLGAPGSIWCFVDLLMPDISGLEMVRRLRAEPPTSEASITMIFEEMDKDLILRALHAGADDYIVGKLSADDVLKRIEHGPVATPVREDAEHISLGDIMIEPGAYRVKYRGQRVNLAPNEFKLLMHFANSPDRVFSRDDLILSLGKPADMIDHRTVDVWIGRLRNAFKKVGAPEVVRTVRPIGYVFEIPVTQP
jgi:two-component system phosphate regulon response regulator PhoB